MNKKEKKQTDKEHTKNGDINRSLQTIFLLQIGFVVVVSLLMVLAGGQPPLYFVGVLALLVMMLRVRTRGFIVSFAPFLLLFITYLMIRAFADDIALTPINVHGVLSWEKALFAGAFPTRVLQQMIVGSSLERVITGVSDFVYLSHFITPIIVALIVWYYKKRLFFRYMIGLMILSYVGFIGFSLFPTAPPWWAQYHGYLSASDAIQYVSSVPFDALRNSPNPVAAMPSLHSAYGLYIALSIVMIWGKRVYWVFLYPALVAFATVYLGHHYVVDVIAGWGMVGVLFSIYNLRDNNYHGEK